ncbi:glycine cleavage system aminomethyltransferase GcvT [Brackiella oedipodis]|uniref:glycine cleavage system aminomethyltransferase GcvT n=1 Tax=Brackiella oedipodis TaxID=124225 RepID=UPI00049063A7|nr:glycine cleavage system aminomethyltransferase GcvT [Brackiella oedipodis]
MSDNQSTTLLQTALHPVHVAAGAKMVDFGGWSMPVSYGSQIEEHKAVREHAGMFDVSHMLNVDITGPDTYAFLRRLLGNDVSKIHTTPGKALYGCMLNEEGGIIDDLITYYFDDTHWRSIVNAGCADKDVNWMQSVIDKEGFDVKLTTRRDLSLIAIQGPKAREIVWQVRPQWQAAADLKPFNSMAFENGQVVVARTGYTGEDGVEVALPSEQVEQFWQDLQQAGVQPCGLGARDTLRLEAGLNLYGSDMDESIQPTEAGLAWTVDKKDESRDFIGRKALENPRKRAFKGLKLEGRGVMRAHMKVKVEGGEGETTSGTMSPTLGYSIAFARLPSGTPEGAEAEVEIRGKWLKATVCKLPFVRNGKAVVS